MLKTIFTEDNITYISIISFHVFVVDYLLGADGIVNSVYTAGTPW